MGDRVYKFIEAQYKHFEIEWKPFDGLPRFISNSEGWWVRGIVARSKPTTQYGQAIHDLMIQGSDHFMQSEHWSFFKKPRLDYLIDHKIDETIVHSKNEKYGYYHLMGLYFRLSDENLLLYKLKYA